LGGREKKVWRKLWVIKGLFSFADEETGGREMLELKIEEVSAIAGENFRPDFLEPRFRPVAGLQLRRDRSRPLSEWLTIHSEVSRHFPDAAQL
jgi:hypothetical protein